MGHGTHVSGTIGGLTYGVAKNATIHAGLPDRPYMHPQIDLQSFGNLQPAAQAVHLLVCLCVLPLSTDCKD